MELIVTIVDALTFFRFTNTRFDDLTNDNGLKGL